MTPDRYEQIKRVFIAASEMPPQEATTYLDEACRDDPELRKEVESLLHYHLPQTIVGSYGSAPAHAGPATTFSVGEAKADQQSTPVASPHAEKTPRFAPGTILAGRYRIIGALGRGGMGDVYRADDLKLDESVALKFLSREHVEDPKWLRRYENEVRLARRVTHPNVLRVFDMIESDGEAYISMEYVDGEDLASLLRRIGRVTGEKAIEITRQLCAGLGAAHNQGVLHRDLKPANVMIDGRGQVRIADFGIAALAATAEENRTLVGTPAYMAPELFQGDAPSISSDLFALGIVLYELVTGKEPFESLLLARGRGEITPTRPSSRVPNIDPALERVILQCLEREPDRRPDSVYAIAAALPGGDPLAAALAAGETPSPSMVAAANSGGVWPAWMLASCFALALIALLLVVWLADRTFLLPQAGMTKPPAVLADKAQHLIAALGRGPAGAEHWQGFAIDHGYVENAIRADDPLHTWKTLGSGRPPGMCFWYRAGGGYITLPGLLGEPASAEDDEDDEKDVVTVRLDGHGRLLQYVVMPKRARLHGVKRPDAVDWSKLFQMAGLSMADFRPSAPHNAPPMYADTVMAWQGTPAKDASDRFHVEAASLGGRVVYFDVVPPWEPDWTNNASEGAPQSPVDVPLPRLILSLFAIIAGGFLAWHNLRSGRGDYRGANKLALLVFFLALLDWLLGERHVAVLSDELALLYLWMGRAILTAAIVWICYFAVEPYVRRYWPQIMISWSRVLKGKIRDPLIGRDLLLGGALGVLLVLVLQLDIALPLWFGQPPPLPKLPRGSLDLMAAFGLRYKISALITCFLGSLTLALLVTLLMLLVRARLRLQWLAVGTTWLLLALLQRSVTGSDCSYPWLMAAIVSGAAILLLVNVGVLALAACAFVLSLLLNSPLTSNLAAWYAPAGNCAVAIVAGLLTYGFWCALAGRPLLRRRLAGE